MRFIEFEEVIYIYSEIIRRTGGEARLNDEKILESILAKPMVTFEGEELYPDLFIKVAVFIYAFVNSRPFIDGNKRTALICALFILRVNGYQVIAPQEKLVELVVSIEEGRYKVDSLVNWFRKNAVPL